MDQKSLEQFAEMIRESSRIVFFGGAGVSTESGVKDYRSEDGLYNTVRQYGVSPETILSHSFFLRQTDVFYDFYYNYFLKTQAEPNRAHRALAELEQMGKLTAVITQNIDGLHQKGGSRRVLELHGSVRNHFCMSCRREIELKTVLDAAGKVPRCPQCGGLVKPKVVLYEESLDDQVVNDAVNAISDADMLIIGGTSLAVYPAAAFVRYFRGSRTVLINRDETAYDDHASLIFREKIGEVLSLVMEKVRG